MTNPLDDKPVNRWERGVLTGSRLLALVAVAASLVGAVLMFWLGAQNTIEAIATQIGEQTPSDSKLPPDDTAIVVLMLGLDRFMIGVVLLFFAYGVYSLFIRPGRSSAALGLPEWLHVTQIGQLKQTLAEVIIVVLFVLFLRVALESFHRSESEFTPMRAVRFFALPVSILLLSAALRLVELHPKPRRPHHDGDASIMDETDTER